MAPAGAIHGRTRGLPFIAGIFLFFTVILHTHCLPTRTEKLISEDERYYWVERQDDRIRCLLCPAGTYVLASCTEPDTKGICEICPEDTFIQFSSGLSECLACSRCRDDQEEVSSCNVNRDTVCKCRMGTYCPPGQSCEICSPCTGSCPEDDVVQTPKAPCSSTLDMPCTTPEPSIDTKYVIITIVIILLALLGIIIGVYIYWKRRKSDKGSKIFGKLTLHLCKGNNDYDESEGDLLPRNILLQYKEGIDSGTKEEIISKSYVIIVQLTPVKDFESLMQHLGLSLNEIERAKMENPSIVNNQYSAMLHTWNQRKGFDINVLLQSLRRLKMDQAARDITRELIDDGLFVPQTQHDV